MTLIKKINELDDKTVVVTFTQEVIERYGMGFESPLCTAADLKAVLPVEGGDAKEEAMEIEARRASVKAFPNHGNTGSCPCTLCEDVRFGVRWGWRSASLAAAVQTEWVKELLKLRDALLAGDTDEAYHVLYSMADPKHESTEPWARWEKLAEAEA